jgi:hypothetical protein
MFILIQDPNIYLSHSNIFSKVFSTKSRAYLSPIRDTRLAHRTLLQFNCTNLKIGVMKIWNVPFALQLLGPDVSLGLLPKVCVGGSPFKYSRSHDWNFLIGYGDSPVQWVTACIHFGQQSVKVAEVFLSTSLGICNMSNNCP